MSLVEDLQQKITDYLYEQDKRRIDEEIKRAMVLGGGLGNSAQNVANSIYQNQINTAGQAQQNAAGNLAGAQQSKPNWGNLHGTFGAGNDSGAHVTQGIMSTFALADKELHEFATATAKLLDAEINAAWSPHYAHGRASIVWQIYSYKWNVDEQWIEGNKGGTEEDWTKHFARIADKISEQRETGAKPRSERPLHGVPAGLAQMAQQHNQLAQMSLVGQQLAQLRQGQAAQAMNQNIAQQMGLSHVTK